MKLTIEIESENDGANDNFAVAELVRGVARKITGGQESGTILDVNGNSVGSWEYEREEEEEEEEEDCEEDDEEIDEVDRPENCPACHSDRIEYIGALGTHEQYKCKSCGTIFSPHED